MNKVLTGPISKASTARWPIGLALMLLAGACPLLGVLGPPAPAAAATPGASPEPMPLQEFANTATGGRIWDAQDQSVTAAGPTILGRPAPVLFGTVEQVFAQGANGDLVQYAADGLGGRAWNAYDLTQLAGAPQIASDPAAIVVGGSSLYVFFQASGTGDLTEVTNSGPAGQPWTTLDLSATSGTPITGDPSVVSEGGTLEVFAQSTSGHLIAFSGSGSGTLAWTSTDVTGSTGAGIEGSPGAIVFGSTSLHVYAQGWGGALTEFVNDGPQGPWSAYNLTVDAAGPTISGQPDPIVYGATVHVYVNASGQLFEVDNDDAGGRLWNAYDLSALGAGPTVTGDPTAVFWTKTIVDVFVQGASGDLFTYVNDDAGGRLWNAYDLTATSGGPSIGTDPTAIIEGGSISVFAGGPPAPGVIQSILHFAEIEDQHNYAVTENPPGSNCNIFSAYWGRGTTAGCAPGTSAEEWCSDFAQWVWAAAGIPTNGINGWSYTFVDWALDHPGAWKPGATNNPEPGDAVLWGDTSAAYAIHVGIVVGVSAGQIDVVSGNSGPPIDAAGDVDAVWETGYFDPSTSTDSGYPIIGYVSPTGWSEFSPSLRSHALSPSQLAALIATQDGGH
ncbi:MAG: CHAP domain-containing protein [Acidimicrobiales bacterium]